MTSALACLLTSRELGADCARSPGPARHADQKCPSMTTEPTHSQTSICASSAGVWLFLSFSALAATPRLKARVSQVIRDVKLLPAERRRRVRRRISDEVRDGTAVRTGVESRAELTFTDQTLARLGANTIFTFNEGTRDLELGGGAMLLQRAEERRRRKDQDRGWSRRRSPARPSCSSITPTPISSSSSSRAPAGSFATTGSANRSCCMPGQMLIVNPKGTGLPQPVDVDLARLKKTSALLSGKFSSLPSKDLIGQEIRAQEMLKAQQALARYQSCHLRWRDRGQFGGC